MKNQKQILNKKGLTEQVKKIYSVHYQEKFVMPGSELLRHELWVLGILFMIRIFLCARGL